MEMNKETILTEKGLQELERELEHLKTVGRQEIAEKIKVARSFGDLSENSEYDEAMSDQGKMEARILEIEYMLKNVKIIDEDNINTDKVIVGSKVTIKDLETKEKLTYQIVGFAQADPDNGRISDESPVGKALLDKKVGETVNVEVPAGVISFKIMSISK
ncbi:MAG: transcription elongation factor GreA [Clostridia bacterium]|nr:transcription elongation factor GreA [Clostridia bacterium]